MLRVDFFDLNEKLKRYHILYLILKGNPNSTSNNFQIILDLYIPEKELAKTHSQIAFIYFQSHSWYSVRNYIIPKGIMKTSFEPRLPRMSSWKSIKNHTLDLNSGPLHHWQIFSHCAITARDLMSPQSCPSQDPSWGNISAKQVKVTGKNESPW